MGRGTETHSSASIDRIMSEESPTIEDLLEHAGWLSGLARRLVRDASIADDVVQQTLLQAIRRPPRSKSAAAGWLARVARNEAKQIGRSEHARQQREQRVGRMGTAPATIDIVARAEIHRRLVEALFSIQEPFRTTLLLRYFDGLEPKAIARELDCPPSTVRTRLKRGLDRLRYAMDERSNGDRRTWTLSLMTFVNPRSLAGFTRTGGALSTETAVGASVMGAKSSVIGLSLLLLLGIGLIVVLDPRSNDEVGEQEANRAASKTQEHARASDPQLEGQFVKAAHSEASDAHHLKPSPVRPRVVIQFTDERGLALETKEVQRRYRECGLPTEALLVSESILAPAGTVEAAIRRISGSKVGRDVFPWSTGSAGFALNLKPGTWRLFVARPGAAPLLTSPFEVTEEKPTAAVQLLLPSEVEHTHLRLVAADTSAPLAGAALVPYFELGDDLAFFEGPTISADNKGEARLPHLETPFDRRRKRGITWWIVAEGRLTRLPSNVLHREGTHTVRVPRTGDVFGRAYGQDGQPAAGHELVWTRKGRRVSTHVNSDGSFRIRGLPAANWNQQLVLIEDARAMRMTRAKVFVRPGEQTETIIGASATDVPRSEVQGRLTAGGRAFPNAMIMAFPKGTHPESGHVTRSDPDGNYRLTPAAGAIEFVIYLGGADDFVIRSTKPLMLVEHQEERLDFDLPSGQLHVTLIDAATGHPIRGGGVYAAPADRKAAQDRFPGFAYRAGSSATVGSDGTAVLRALVPGEAHTLQARAEGYERIRKHDVHPATEGEEPTAITLRMHRK